MKNDDMTENLSLVEPVGNVSDNGGNGCKKREQCGKFEACENGIDGERAPGNESTIRMGARMGASVICG